MAFLTRIVAAAALFSFVYAGASGPSAAENYAVAARRAREHHQRAPLVRAAPDRVRRRGMQRRCKGSTPTTTTTTTSPYPTSKTWNPNHETSTTTSSTTQPPTQTPGNPSSGGKKKALAWGGSTDELAAFVNDHVGYIYNWREDPPQQSGLQAASMLWGYKNLDGFRQKRAQYPILMGPNEFNLGSQAAMSVSDVVSLWNAEVRPYGGGKTLVSPSVTTAPDGLSQLQQFFSTCGGTDNCGVHVISAHYYGNKASDLIDYLTKMHNALPFSPIWLSEFSCQPFDGQGDCSQDQAWAFMEGVVKFCETTDWIWAYAPYGLMKDLGNVNPVNALMDSNGKPTALGQYFLDTVY